MFISYGRSNCFSLTQCQWRIFYTAYIAQLLERTDGTRHRVDSFEGDDLRDVSRHRLQELLQMPWVVVPEYVLWDAAVPDALDHWGVVAGIREYVAPWTKNIQLYERFKFCHFFMIFGKNNRNVLLPLQQRKWYSHGVDSCYRVHCNNIWGATIFYSISWGKILQIW